MARLDEYRSALLAAFPEVTEAELVRVLDAGGPQFVSFVVDHGLGPLWHERTGRDEFRESRLSAEALYLAQECAVAEIDSVFDAEGIEYACIKGSANRLLLYENPAIRACYDLDIVVLPADRVRAASALVDAGFTAVPDMLNISHELVLSRAGVDVDLHWGFLREGRMRRDCTPDMLGRRRRSRGVWMLSADDAFFLLLVHPAFVSHLSGWGMGLHRVADILAWLGTQPSDWQAVRSRLERCGVQTAAWATLRWLEFLSVPNAPDGLDRTMSDIGPGRLRRAWLDRWLSNDLSNRTSGSRWVRLLGFSFFLHDTLGDATGAFVGRSRAHRRRQADLDVFGELIGQ